MNFGESNNTKSSTAGDRMKACKRLDGKETKEETGNLHLQEGELP